MGIGNGLFKNIRSVKEDDYDDDDLYDDEELDDDYDDDEDDSPKKNAKPKKSLFGRRHDDDDDDDLDDDLDDDDDDGGYKPASNSYRPTASYTQKQAPQSNVTSVRPRGNSPEVSMIMPKKYDDANTIADVLLSHRAVVLNLEGIPIAAAQRLIDFAAGASYMIGGTLQKISPRIFIIAPDDMYLSGDFDDIISGMIDLNTLTPNNK